MAACSIFTHTLHKWRWERKGDASPGSSKLLFQPEEPQDTGGCRSSLRKAKALVKNARKHWFCRFEGEDRIAEVFLSVSTVFAETICNRGVKKGGHMRCSPGAACYNDASPGDSVAFGWDISPRTLSLAAYCRCQVPRLLLLLLDICRVPVVHLVLLINSNKLPIFNSGPTGFPLVKICLFASSGTVFSKGKYAI